jgi:putative sterol carrier protein
MSEMIDQAVAALNAKITGGFDGVAKFVLGDEGSIIIDSAGARASDDDAEVTLSADPDVFQAILSGDMNPTSAFMTGKLSVDGDMGKAMQLAGVLG